MELRIFNISQFWPPSADFLQELINEITPRTKISPSSMNEFLVLKTTCSFQAAALQIIVPTSILSWRNLNQMTIRARILNPYLGDFGNVRERHFWTKNPELLFRFWWRHTWLIFFSFIIILNYVSNANYTPPGKIRSSLGDITWLARLYTKSWDLS